MLIRKIILALSLASLSLACAANTPPADVPSVGDGEPDGIAPPENVVEDEPETEGSDPAEIGDDEVSDGEGGASVENTEEAPSE